jgi:DNA polymerase-3 subunit alpha
VAAGEFRSLYDFCERVEPRFLNKRVLESLIKSGALDSLGSRESMTASVDDIVSALQRIARAKDSGQHGLFGGGGAAPEPAHFELRDAPQWSEEERLASEYAMLGFYVSGHPLERHASRLQEMKVVTLGEVEGQRNGKELLVAALIVGTRPMRSKKGARWAIYTIQDMTGVQELLAFPEAFARLEPVLKPGSPLLLKVKIQVEEAGTRLSLQEARRLDQLAEQTQSQEFRVRLEVSAMHETLLDELEDLLGAATGSTPVIFELAYEDGAVVSLASRQMVRVTPELVNAVERATRGPGAQAAD